MKPCRRLIRVARALPFVVFANVFDWLAARSHDAVDVLLPPDRSV
jgi:hypothetical protein